MVRNPILLERGVLFEKGCLPRVLYQFPRDRFSVVDRGNVAIEAELVVHLVEPS